MLAERERFDSAMSRNFLSSLELTDSLTRAYAGLSDLQLSGVADILKWAHPLQETAAHAAGMRARVEQALEAHDFTPQIRGLAGGLSNLTVESADLWEDVADEPSHLMHLPEVLREAPVVQVFEATRSTALLVVPDEETMSAAPAPGLIIMEAGHLEVQLDQIGSGLVTTYRGAIDTFHRRGPDYIRQTSVSLRELLTHLLRLLAPQARVDHWDPDPKNYENGELTRKARLRFIFRGLASLEGYSKMAVKDAEHVEQNFFLLNTSVHELAPEIAHELLRSLIRRCEFDILAILHAHEVAAGMDAG